MKNLQSRRLTAAGLLMLCTLLGCTKPKEANDDLAAREVRVPVKIRPLAKRSIESMITATGNTDALRKEKLFSPIAGKVIALRVLEGSPVRAGDVLAILRTKEAQAAYDGAQALLRNATNEQQQEEAKHALALADSLQPQILVRAHFDGIVSSRNVMEGELVGEQSELLTVIDPATIVFIADIPLASLAEIRPALSAHISIPDLPGGPMNAVVEAINPQAESQSQSVKVRLRFRDLSATQRRLLKSHLPGTASIITGVHRDTFVIRRSTLLHDDETNANSVIVMTKDSLAEVIPVDVGIQTDSLVEISSPRLHAGMDLISEGQYALADSTRVTVDGE
jgi:membrane fusion protein (multidrug efflux system)